MSGAAWSAWAALVLAACLWRIPSTRSPLVGRTEGTPRRRGRPWARLFRARAHRNPENEVGRVLVSVAARLRAGIPPGQAWERSLRDAAPDVGRALRAALPGPPGNPPSTAPVSWPRRPVRRGASSAATRTAVDSAIVARDVALGLGAELAGVLESCAAGIQEAGRAAADRAGALGGPRATARLLGWLPMGGLVLGTGLGADPLAWLTGTGAGRLIAAIAAGLTLVGRWWIRRLITLAERAGR